MDADGSTSGGFSLCKAPSLHVDDLCGCPLPQSRPVVRGLVYQVESGHIMAWKVEQKSMQLIVEPPTQAEIEESRQGKISKKAAIEKTQAQKDQVQRYYTFDRCFDDDGAPTASLDFVL